MGLLDDIADLVKGAATGFPNAADVATPAPAMDRFTTPAGATVNPNTWPDDWWPQAGPAPGPGFGPSAAGPLTGFAPTGGYGYGPSATGPLAGFDPTGGRGAGPTEAELAAMVAGLQAEQDYSWYDPRGWGAVDPGEDFFTGFFGEGGTGRNILGGVEEGARWLADPTYQALGELLEGDLSEAVGDFVGGTATQLAPAAGYLGKELGQMGVDLADNIYNNWGLRSGLNQFGADITGIPGQLGNLGMAGLGQLGNLGQAGLQQLGDLRDYLDSEIAGLGQTGWEQLRGLGGEIGDFATQQVLPWAQQQIYDPMREFYTETVPEFVTDQAIPYFQQDFVGDVQNLYGGLQDWAVDDAWGQAIQPFYENVLKPVGLDIADWAVDDVWKDVLEPLYENYLKPAGLAVADFTTQEAWPYIRDHLRHDISDVLEKVPAVIRNVLPEGSRADDALEALVGGIGTGYDFVTETAPGAVADFASQGYGYLFDPSQPSFGGDAAAEEFTPEEQAYFEAAVDAGFFGPADAGAGVAAPAAPAAAPVAAPVVAPAGPMITYPGGVSGAGPPTSAREVADQIYAAAQGVPGGLSDLYSQMFDSQRTWAQDAYGAQMRNAAAAGQASQDYAASILQQGEQAAAQAEAAAGQYYARGADEASRAYNETVTGLNNREQGLIQRYAQLAAAEAAGAADTAGEQRRVSAELESLQTDRTSLRHSLIMQGLTEEEARRTTRLDEFEDVRRGRLASDEAALIQMISGLETGRVGQEQALAQQLAGRFTGARAGMQQRIDAAEAVLREQGIEPAAYTAAPGAETQLLLTSQELSMQTLQNRLRDASAAQAIDRQMRGSEIYSAAGRALEDNLFAMRSQLEDSIAQRKGIANLDTFDRQADIDIATAAERGEINLQELAALQASKEALFGRKTDLFGESELNRIYTRSDYNAALATERAAQQRAMEAAQQQRIIAEAAAAQQAFAGEQSRLQREHEAAISAKETAAAIAQAESAEEIAQIEADAAESQRLAEDYIMVNVDGVDVPVDRDWYIEEHLIGPGAGSDPSSDVNLMEMEDSAGNRFFVDVGGVDELGRPYLTSSAATNPLITGDILTPAWAE